MKKYDDFEDEDENDEVDIFSNKINFISSEELFEEEYLNSYDDEKDDDEYFIFYQQEQKIKLLELRLKQQKLKRKLITDSVKILQGSFFWNFLKIKTKIKYINLMYDNISQLVFEKEKKEEKEEKNADL